MSWNPSSWGDPFEDLYNKGKDAVVDAAQEVAHGVTSVSELVGDGVTDVAGMVGEGVVTIAETAGKWSVTAAGDVVDWSQTSFSEVRAWTETAAGDFAGFVVEAYADARDVLVEGAAFVYEQLTRFLAETLPELGPIDATVRAVAVAILTEPVVDGLEKAARAGSFTVTIGLKAQALGTATAGIYVCGAGWGLFTGATLNVMQGVIGLLKDGVTIGASMAMIFGPRERASGAKAIKLGIGLSGKAPNRPKLAIGGVLLMEATMPPLFLGFRYEVALSFGPGGKKQPDADGKVKWKVAISKPGLNGEFFAQATEYGEFALEEVSAGLHGTASNWDAAVRAFGDPAGADRIAATAASAALSPFMPRYYGGITAANGSSQAPNERPVLGDRQGALGVVGVTGELRTTFCVVAGLGDPRHVSIEAVGDPTLYWWADPSGSIKLAPYSQSLDVARATFRMVRGLDGRGIALILASDQTSDPRFVICSDVVGDMVMPSASLFLARLSEQQGALARFRRESTFLLDRAADVPAHESALLREGEALLAGQARRAPNGLFSLHLASNGRLAIRRRGPAGLDGPNAWIVYEPGMVQDQVLLWAWASPTAGVDDGQYWARVADGRIEVRRGTPAADAGLHWQSQVHGAPGRCFLAVTNEGVVTVLRGDPDDAGEAVWTSPTGPLHWATRRQTVILRAPDGTWVTTPQGGGKREPTALTPPPPQPVRAGATVVGGWEHFELAELWSGKVALRAQARRCVGVVDGGAVLEVRSDQPGDRQLFTLEVVATPDSRLRQVRLRAEANGRHVGVGGGAALVADRDQAGAAIFGLYEVDHDLTAHAGRAVYVIARHSGLCVEPPSGAEFDGAALVQRRFGAHAYQQWHLRFHGGGDFSLINRANDKALDVFGGGTANGTGVIQWPWHGGANQRVRLRPAGDGSYHLIMAHSGRALDVPAGRTDPGAPIIQWDAHSGANQRFELRLADPGKTSIWRPHGGALTTTPAIVSWGPGRLDVFARGTDGAAWQVAYDGTWRDWRSMGGQFPAEVTALAPYAGRLDLFVRGMTGDVCQAWWDGSKWNGWASHGGVITSNVCALAPFQGRWDVFVRGTDGALWQRWAHDGWSPWTRLGGQITGTPTALYEGGRWYVFARGDDGALWLCATQPDWSWTRLDGGIIGEPAAVSCGAGCVDVFARAADNTLWTRSLRDGAWQPWALLGGHLTTDPVAVSCAPQRVDVLARGADGGLIGRRLEGGVWQPWREYGAELAGKPAAVASGPGQIGVAIVTGDRSLLTGVIR